jgi:hypothetical protein
MLPKNKTTIINITTYQSMGYYWSGYHNQEVKLEMIQYIIKDAGYAFSYGTESTKLYQIIMKDGNKMYTDLGGFKKIAKLVKEKNINILIKK